MKKAIISAALVAAISAGGYMGFRANNSQSDQLSDVMLANIEALADGESLADCTFAKVSADENKNELKCSGQGHLCCRFPRN